MGQTDYYNILGVEKNATDADIKKAFRKLAVENHPDRNKSLEAEKKMNAINEANSILSDPEKRKMYDLGGSTNGFRFNGAGDPFVQWAESMMSKGFGQRRTDMPTKGEDVQVPVAMTLEEIAIGATKKVEVEIDVICDQCKENPGLKPGKTKKTCQDCSGRGRIASRTTNGNMVMIREVVCHKCSGKGFILDLGDMCEKCSGTGFVSQTKTLEVQFPAGIFGGQGVCLSNEGSFGLKGGPSGDVIAVVDEQKHKIFQRQGNLIILELPVSISQAVLGEKVEVPTIYGKNQQIDIPAGTQDGSFARIDQMGMPIIGTEDIDAMIVVFRIAVPKKINADYKDLVEKLKEAEKELPTDNKLRDIENYKEHTCSQNA